MNKNDCQSI